MDTLFKLYEKTHSVLKKLDDRLAVAYSEIEELECEYEKSWTRIVHDTQKTLENNKMLADKVTAYINIASTHTTVLVKATSPIEYNSGTLSRIAVQINSNNGDDPFANQLYTEATGQLLFLDLERISIEQKCEIIHIKLKEAYDKRYFLLQRRVDEIKKTFCNYLKSSEFQQFIFIIEEDNNIYNGLSDKIRRDYVNDNISIGLMQLPFPVPKGLEYIISEFTRGYCDIDKKTISVPKKLLVTNGCVLIAEYENPSEQIVLEGIQNLFLNIIRYCRQNILQLCFIDPIRFNSSSLGCLSMLCDKEGGIIDFVPSSIEEIRTKLKSIVTEISIRELRNASLSIKKTKKAIYVFHDFPHSYDNGMITQIQQLCVNAEHYGIIVVLTHNKSANTHLSTDVLKFIQSFAINIYVLNGKFECLYNSGDEFVCFNWNKMPKRIPTDIEQMCVNEKNALDLSTDYVERIGFNNSIEYKKGIRRIDKIPYGIDNKGTIQYLDFENSNFATYICGAARSGKSTLLHTLITGMIKNNHPDDIEIWLIDFKMTEFSRYVQNLPPHVRYIILDESPEIVFDIIDRLTEILIKRQNMFKGKWQKLSDVPVEKYMPAMMIIIDEFSVMSQIIADSIISNNENYSVKLQMLLAKGAALGMHFIFSSQGFTNGTRGLNEFSKQQVQQRIAMKTEFIEIKDTLDLKSASEDDKVLMEQLPVHHALLKINADEYGNHLKLAQVLFISDYLKQEEFIATLNKRFSPVSKYNVNDAFGYIDKKPLIKDGNTYFNYANRIEEIREHILKQNSIIDDEILLYIGEPRRMLTICPISIYNEFCENILMISPNSEKMATSSIVISLTHSLELQQCEFEIWTSKRNQVYQQLNIGCGMQYVYINTLDSICTQIENIKEAIQSKKENNKFFILLGFESLLTDMSFQTTYQNTPITKTSQLSGVIRKHNEPDLNIFLSSLTTDTSIDKFVVDEPIDDNHVEERAYDAREDLKYILTNGPRLGYHFMMIFNTVGDIYQSRIDISLFKHKLFFRTSKTDASSLVGAADAEVISKLEDYSFRYSNGLDKMSFRPFLHPGLFWDGWQICENGVINNIDEEDEYLL